MVNGNLKKEAIELLQSAGTCSWTGKENTKTVQKTARAFAAYFEHHTLIPN